MAQVLLRVALWSALYLGLITLPLALVAFLATPERRDFWIEFGVGLGIVGFVMLGLQFLTTARFRRIAPYFGCDAVIYFHRRAGILALLIVLGHPVVLFLADPGNLAYLDPGENLPRAVFLSLATLALLLIVALPLWGLRWGLSYEWWRVTHGLLSAAVLLVALVHVLQVGHYVSGVVQQAIWIGMTLFFLGLLIHVRLVKPWSLRRRPYRVADVTSERGVTVLALEPVDHGGMTFQAGQYAWITLGDSPFTLQQHPFSFASSSEQTGRLEFAIKATGDFTGTVSDVTPGTRAFLEGPYGSFTLDPHAEAIVFIMGGIGVTPALSMLRTASDQGDRRPFMLFYGNPSRSEIAFHDEIESLTETLELKVVHVLSEPESDWTGESGMITKEVLDRHLEPLSQKDIQYFVCGPPPMLDAVEKALLERGAHSFRILAERFDFI